MRGYSPEYYQEVSSLALPSAKTIVPIVLELTRATSVVDIGCGAGAWLSVFKELGCSDVLGIDGPWVDDTKLLINKTEFVSRNLTEKLAISKRFDLALSLEVAEHLAADHAERHIEDLANLAPVVLFSAAVPGQGGVHHVNEQWPEHWSDLFSYKGYEPIDTLRWMIWDNTDVAWFYKQNLVIYASRQALEANPELRAARATTSARGGVPAVVHPELLRLYSNPRFLRSVRLFGKAVARLIRLPQP